MDEILKLKAGKQNGRTYLNQPMLLLVAWNGLMKCTIRCTVSGFFSPLWEPLCHRRTVERLSAKSEIKSRRTVIKSSKSSRIDLKNGSKKQKKTENQHCRNFSDLLNSGGLRDWNRVVHALYDPFQNWFIFGSIDAIFQKSSGARAPLPHL